MPEIFEGVLEPSCHVDDACAKIILGPDSLAQHLPGEYSPPTSQPTPT